MLNIQTLTIPNISCYIQLTFKKKKNDSLSFLYSIKYIPYAPVSLYRSRSRNHIHSSYRLQQNNPFLTAFYTQDVMGACHLIKTIFMFLEFCKVVITWSCQGLENRYLGRNITTKKMLDL